MTNLLLFIGAVLISIIGGSKTKTNMGFWAICCALLLGYFRLDGMGAARVLSSNFPVALFYNMFSVAMFFGFANLNGTITALAHKLRYQIRGTSWAGPLSLFILSVVLTACGANAMVISPFTYSIAIAMGLHPFMGIAACNMGQIALLLMPFCQTGGTNNGILQGFFTPEQSFAGMYYTGAAMFVFMTIEYVVCTFVFKAYSAASQNASHLTPPEPFTPVQKKNLTAIVVVLVILLGPSLTQVIAPNPVTRWLSSVLSIQFLWTAGAIVLAIMNCGDLKEVVTKKVPWHTLMMIVGMSILFGLADDLGVVDYLSEVLFRVPAWMVVPILAGICGTLSLFVSGSIITPLFVSFAESIMSITGVSLNVIVCAICGGASVASISPVSAGGASALIGCTDEEERPRVTKIMTAIAIINIVLIVPYTLIQSLIF